MSLNYDSSSSSLVVGENGSRSLGRRTSELHRQSSLPKKQLTLTEEEAKQLDEECMQRFIKLNCRIVTKRKGYTEGVLIITPSAVMFDPIEPTTPSSAAPLSRRKTSRDDESSSIIPIEIISNVIMYEDLTLRDVQEYFEFKEQIE